MRFLIYLLVVLFLWPQKNHAQHYNLSNKSQISQKKHIYHTVIGENEWGIFTVNYTDDYFSGGFSIERYDRELGFLDEKLVQLTAKSKVLEIFQSDSMIYWVYVSKKKRENFKLYISQIKADFEGEVKTNYLEMLPIRNWNPDEIKFSYDGLNRIWSLGIVFENQLDGTTLWSQVRNLDGNLIENYRDSIPQRFDEIFFSKFKTANHGEVLALIQFQKVKNGLIGSQRNLGVYIFRGNKKYQGFGEWNLSEPLQSSMIQFDNYHHQWLLFSLMGSAPKEIKGYSLIKIDDQKSLFIQTDQYFDSKTASILEDGFASGKRKTPAITHFICRRIIPQRNNGSLILVERYHELKQLETYYLNGIPQTATKLIYQFDEIGAIFLDSESYIDTVLRIEKEQSAAPVSSYLLGFGSFVCDDGVHLIFNGDISKNNDIKQVIIRPDYKVENHTLLSSDNFYNAVVPFDGMESEYCTFTLPLLRDKQWFWMQIKDRD